MNEEGMEHIGETLKVGAVVIKSQAHFFYNPKDGKVYSGYGILIGKGIPWEGTYGVEFDPCGKNKQFTKLI